MCIDAIITHRYIDDLVQDSSISFALAVLH